ncbi:MAG TPA: hypothetical protein VJQ25_09565, partial [Nitrospira sp.]|nr:hypothetical protein [Nitrospira sp.]
GMSSRETVAVAITVGQTPDIGWLISVTRIPVCRESLDRGYRGLRRPRHRRRIFMVAPWSGSTIVLPV